MANDTPIAEYMVEFPTSKNPEIDRKSHYTFYTAHEAWEFAGPLIKAFGDRVTVFERSITVSEWRESINV